MTPETIILVILLSQPQTHLQLPLTQKIPKKAWLTLAILGSSLLITLYGDR